MIHGNHIEFLIAIAVMLAVVIELSGLGDKNDDADRVIPVRDTPYYQRNSYIEKKSYVDICRHSCFNKWNHRKLKTNLTVDYLFLENTSVNLTTCIGIFTAYIIFYALLVGSMLRVLINTREFILIKIVAKTINKFKSRVPQTKLKVKRMGRHNRQLDLYSFERFRPVDTDQWIYTVPRYPDNHNPLLPLNLQQQLDEMSPREYLTYVLKELTLEERESLMVDEKQRRRSFLVNWPYDDQRSGIRMAQAGFYSLDAYDRVQCVFCRGSLHNWDTGETPLTEHSRSFNFCRFVKGQECGNREYRTNVLSEDDMINITKFPKLTDGSDRLRAGRDGVTADSTLLGISTNRASTIQYAPAASRLKTYSRWPPTCPITAQRMCDAGFFYTHFDDQVRCFYCSGGIKQWSEKDEPWEEHARWFPDCAYLIQQKGQSYVDEVHAKTPANKKCVRKTQSQKKDEIIQVEHCSIQQDMKEFCLKLGHSPELINRAIEIKGRPFETVKDLIDLLYALDESDSIPSDPPSPISMPHHNFTATMAEEDLYNNQDQAAQQLLPGRFDGSESQRKYQLGCVICERKTASFVKATHIGLPCGHLIFCENCNGDQVRQTINSHHKVLCPLKTCQAPLQGTLKTFFA